VNKPLAVCLLVLCCLGCTQREQTTAAPPAIPRDLQLVGLDGTVARLSAYRGRIVVLNFWATWCAPCRAEMDSLERLSQSSDPRQLVVIGVSVDKDPNLAREHVLHNGWSFARFIDSRGTIGSGALRIDTLPRTYIIAPDGSTAAVVSGARDWTDGTMRGVLQRAARGNMGRYRNASAAHASARVSGVASTAPCIGAVLAGLHRAGGVIGSRRGRPARRGGPGPRRVASTSALRRDRAPPPCPPRTSGPGHTALRDDPDALRRSTIGLP